MHKNKYQIVVAATVSELMLKVNAMVEFGFKPVGGVTVWIEDGEQTLVQAIFNPGGVNP